MANKYNVMSVIYYPYKLFFSYHSVMAYLSYIVKIIIIFLVVSLFVSVVNAHTINAG